MKAQHNGKEFITNILWLLNRMVIFIAMVLVSMSSVDYLSYDPAGFKSTQIYIEKSNVDCLLVKGTSDVSVTCWERKNRT
jgi:hypothetical protein